MPEETVTYGIDRYDVIAYVGGQWATFAEESETPSLNDDLVGRPLWDFVSGDTTRHVYKDLIARARAGRSLSFTYRCDAPALRRFMRMRMLPSGDGGVTFRSTTERTETRAPVALLEPGARAGRVIVTICSWCKRARVEGGWHEVEVAVTRLGLFDGGPMPGLSHGMCDECEARVTESGEW